jgi:hypothetical protein
LGAEREREREREREGEKERKRDREREMMVRGIMEGDEQEERLQY